MKIDLTCPVEMWHCKMPTAEYPALTMQVYNLSDKNIFNLYFAISFDFQNL